MQCGFGTQLLFQWKVLGNGQHSSKRHSCPFYGVTLHHLLVSGTSRFAVWASRRNGAVSSYICVWKFTFLGGFLKDLLSCMVNVSRTCHMLLFEVLYFLRSSGSGCWLYSLWIFANTRCCWHIFGFGSLPKLKRYPLWFNLRVPGDPGIFSTFLFHIVYMSFHFINYLITPYFYITQSDHTPSSPVLCLFAWLCDLLVFPRVLVSTGVTVGAWGLHQGPHYWRQWLPLPQ